MTVNDYVMVPRVPTEAMWEATLETKHYVAFDRFQRDYKAMLAAAPTPPATGLEPSGWEIYNDAGQYVAYAKTDAMRKAILKTYGTPPEWTSRPMYDAPQPAAAAPREPAPAVGKAVCPACASKIESHCCNCGWDSVTREPALLAHDIADLQRDAESLSKKWRKEAEVLREEAPDEQAGLITGLVSCAHELDATIQARRQQEDS